MEFNQVISEIRSAGLYINTCSAINPEDFCVTFAMNDEYLERLDKGGKEVLALVPQSMNGNSNRIPTIAVEDPRTMFVLVHNHLNALNRPAENKIDHSSDIHPTSSIGNDGMRYVKDGKILVSMKHMGNVVIRERVTVGACSSIARATLDSTIIEADAKIGCGVHIGHNCHVGRRTIIVDGAILGGSVKVGRDCWIGLNATIRNGVALCGGVFVGMHAVVTKNIEKPGTYVGMPARRIGDWNGEW